MRNFQRNIYKISTQESKQCLLSPITVTTTSPTNMAGTDGTAKITVTGVQGSLTYTLNGGAPISVGGSPFIINNLLASTEYTVEVFDSILPDCKSSATFKTGETSFVFSADYMMITYEFLDGRDLDTRSRIVSPNVGQTTVSSMLGWGASYAWPNTGVQFFTWGGDNQGTGFESVLLNIKEFLVSYPNQPELILDFRAFWYGSTGYLDVNVAVTMWKGGVPVKVGYKWENPTAESTLVLGSTGKSVLLTTREAGQSGERVATLIYNLETASGSISNNDTTTPDV